MAQEYYFFDSTKDDIRRFQARHLAEVIDTVLQTGLLHKNKVPMLRVVAVGNSRKLKLTPGKAVIKGRLYKNTTDLELEVPATETVKRVVLRMNNNIDSRNITVIVTEGSKDAAKPLVRDGLIYDLALAQFEDDGKMVFNQKDIIDTRFDEDLCGLASSLISVPTGEFVKEWREFSEVYNKWFESMQGESFATVDYVKKNDDDLREAIAQIQLGGGGGGGSIEGGTSFATDFNAFSNIELREFKARTTTVGSNYVIVDKNPLGVKTGDELTIYNGNTNEKKKVSSVSGTRINFSNSFINTFKPGALVAASMGTLEKGKNQYSFGGWGNTIEFVNDELKYKVANADVVNRTENSQIILTDDVIFVPIAHRDSETRYDVIMFNLRTKTTTTIKGDLIGFTKNDCIYIANSENGDVKIYNKDGSLKVQKNITVMSNSNKNTAILRSKGLIHVRRYGIYELDDNGNFNRKYIYEDSDGFIDLQLAPGVFFSTFSNNGYVGIGDTLHENARISPNTRSSDNVYSVERFFNKQYLVATPTRYESGMRTSLKIEDIKITDEMQWLDMVEMDDQRKEYQMQDISYTSNEIGKGDTYYVGKVDSSELAWYIDEAGDTRYLPSLAQGSYASNEKVIGLATIHEGGAYKPYDKLPSMVVLVREESYGNNYLVVKRNGTLGDGVELLSNDVRFKLPAKSKGLSVTITATDGVTVNAFFGGVRLDKIVLGDKVQFAGMSALPQDEFLVTMSRDRSANSGGLKKMVGGFES